MCDRICNGIYSSCKNARIDGKRIDKLYSSGEELCEQWSWKVKKKKLDAKKQTNEKFFCFENRKSRERERGEEGEGEGEVFHLLFFFFFNLKCLL